MSNRRERRAQTRDKSNETIPFSQPSRNPPTHKTLIDLASERAASLNGSPPPSSRTPPSITTTKVNPDGTLSPPESSTQTPPPENEADPPTPLWLDTLLYTLTLTLLHFTLTLLVHHQYSTHPPNPTSLFIHTTLLPGTPLIILALVYILHPRASQPLVQTLFAVVNVVAGCWLVKASNEDAYLAVMRKAPALGVVWVWAVVELRWEVAVGGLAVVGGWAWWSGYGFR